MVKIVFKPIYVGHIADQIQKEFPDLKPNIMGPSVHVSLGNGRHILADDQNSFRFSFSPKGSPRPDYEIVVFKKAFRHLINDKDVQINDIDNLPDWFARGVEPGDKPLKDLYDGCVIAVKHKDADSFQRLYSFDGGRHRSLGFSLKSAFSKDESGAHFASPVAISEKLVAAVRKYVDLDRHYHQNGLLAKEYLKSLEEFFKKKKDYTVNSALYVPTGSLRINFDIKKEGLVGKLKQAFGHAAGTYKLQLKLDGMDLGDALATKAIDRADVVNIGAIDAHTASLQGEAKLDFIDAVNRAPLVEIDADSRTGHHVKKYVALPYTEANRAVPGQVLNAGLQKVMKECGPARSP